MLASGLQSCTLYKVSQHSRRLQRNDGSLTTGSCSARRQRRSWSQDNKIERLCLVVLLRRGLLARRLELRVFLGLIGQTLGHGRWRRHARMENATATSGTRVDRRLVRSAQCRAKAKRNIYRSEFSVGYQTRCWVDLTDRSFSPPSSHSRMTLFPIRFHSVLPFRCHFAGQSTL